RARQEDRCRTAGRQGRGGHQQRLVRRRPGRGFARHRRAGDGARGRVRVRDPGRGSREDHLRAAGDRLRQGARQGVIPRVRDTLPGPLLAAPRICNEGAGHMSKRRVAVTGLGILSPLGNDLQASWDGIVRGRSGIGPITHFDASGFPTPIAGEVKGFDATQWVAPKDIKKMDPFVLYGVAASMMAIADSGIAIEGEAARRIGVASGSGIGGLKGIEETSLKSAEGGARKVSPFHVPSTISNMVAGQVSIMAGAKGPNIAAVTACTTATHNIGLAMRMIQHGDADAMIAGGAEYATTPTSLGGFCAMKALSTRNDEPEK